MKGYMGKVRTRRNRGHGRVKGQREVWFRDCIHYLADRCPR